MNTKSWKDELYDNDMETDNIIENSINKRLVTNFNAIDETIYDYVIRNNHIFIVYLSIGDAFIGNQFSDDKSVRGLYIDVDSDLQDLSEFWRKIDLMLDVNTYIRHGSKYRKLIYRDKEIIKEGAMQSWAFGELQPIVNEDTVGQTPSQFSDERDFYNPIESIYS